MLNLENNGNHILNFERHDVWDFKWDRVSH